MIFSMKFCIFWRLKFTLIKISQTLKLYFGIFELLHSPKLISRKYLSDRKILKFSHWVWKIPILNYFELPNVRIWEISDFKNCMNFRLSFRFRFVKFRNWFHEIFPSLLFRCLDAGMDPSKVLPAEEATKIYKKQFKSQEFIESDDDSENQWIFFLYFF